MGRIKLLRNKKQIAMKGLRREVADLLRNGKHGNARIRCGAGGVLSCWQPAECCGWAVAIAADALRAAQLLRLGSALLKAF